MSESAIALTNPKSTADYKAAIDALLRRMLELEERMQKDRLEIERLEAESAAIGRHTDAVLDRLDRQMEDLRRAA